MSIELLHKVKLFAFLCALYFKKTKVVFLLCCICYGINAAAKINLETQQPNNIYLEIGGAGGIASINYERLYPYKSNISFGTRIGISTLNIKDFNNTFNPDIIVPITFNAYYGRKHKLVFGVGQTISSILKPDNINWTPKRDLDLHAHFNIGYRLQTQAKGFIYGLSYTPIFEKYKIFKHWAGISVGYNF